MATFVRQTIITTIPYNMRQINRQAWILAMALAAGLSLTGCNGKTSQEGQEQKSAAPASKKQNKQDKDIYFYTTKDRAAKKTVEAEKLGFTNQIASITPKEFEGNTGIREMWIGPNVKHIAEDAFSGCTSLEQVHFQGFVPVINDRAFSGCTALKSLKVNVSTVGLDAFSGCTSLTSAEFGDQIWWIREGAFKDCAALKRIILTITMKKLDDGAFEGCTGVEELTIPNDVKNRMFGMFSAPEKFKKIYLLSTEFYPMPKNCTPTKGCTLYVPDVFLEQYRQDKGWSQFGKVEPLSKTKYYTAEGLWK